MKNLFLILLLLYTFQNSLLAQPKNELIDDVSVLPPNAAALGKFTDIPVDYYTGVPDISVPIHTIAEGGLSLPISLRFHASGTKVSETSSSVGMGWALASGGMVTRRTLGIRDDVGYGYLNNASNLVNPFTPNLPIDQNNQKFYVAHGGWDAEPDMFSFNVNGMSGKFFIMPTETEPEIVMVPKQDIKIEFRRSNNPLITYQRIIGFDIIAPDGTRYQFGTLPEEPDTNTEGLDKQFIPNISAEQNSAYVNWHLRRIQSFDGKYEINLEYENDYHSFKSASACQVEFYIDYTIYSSGCGNGYTFNQVESQRINRIYNSDEEIIFTYNTPREDLDLFPGLATPSKELDEIEVRSITNSGEFCKKFVLDQDYMITSGGNEAEDKRLRLNKVFQYSCGNGTTIEIPPYEFEYSPGNLPSRLSKAKDHWDYFNGAWGNESTFGIPAYDQPQYELPAVPVADRETSESNMLVGSIKKVILPTGGYHEYILEANKINDSEVEQVDTIMLHLKNCNSPTSILCCQNQFITKTFEFESFAEINNSWYTLNFLELNGQGVFPNCASSPFIQITVIANGDIIGSDVLLPNQTYKMQDLSFLNVQPDIEYTFELIVTGGKGDFYIYDFVENQVNFFQKDVGGLRVQEITIHDGVNADNDIVKNFDYDIANTDESSGVLFNPPVYFGSMTSVNGVHQTGKYFSYSAASLSTLEGYTVGYTRVEESIEGNGSTIHNYYTEYTPYIPTSYPYVPNKLKALAGKKWQTRHLAENSNTPILSNEIEFPVLNYEDFGDEYWLYKAEIMHIPPVGGGGVMETVGVKIL